MPAMSDWMDDPDARAWAKRVLDEVAPMVTDSALTVSLVPRGETDIKFAVELGLSIMFDKPILLVVSPGTRLPAQLVRVATEIVEVDMADPVAQTRITEAIERIVGQLG